MVRKRVDQILAPGRGIAHARRSLREEARDGQGGGSAAIEDKALRRDVHTFSDKRCRRRMPHTKALPPVGRRRRIDKRSGRR